MSRYMKEATVDEDAQAYVDVLNGPANGWGAHVCRATGLVSHHLLRVRGDTHGVINFQDAVDSVFKRLKEEIEV